MFPLAVHADINRTVTAKPMSHHGRGRSLTLFAKWCCIGTCSRQLRYSKSAAPSTDLPDLATLSTNSGTTDRGSPANGWELPVLGPQAQVSGRASPNHIRLQEHALGLSLASAAASPVRSKELLGMRSSLHCYTNNRLEGPRNILLCSGP